MSCYVVTGDALMRFGVGYLKTSISICKSVLLNAAGYNLSGSCVVTASTQKDVPLLLDTLVLSRTMTIAFNQSFFR